MVRLEDIPTSATSHGTSVEPPFLANGKQTWCYSCPRRGEEDLSPRLGRRHHEASLSLPDLRTLSASRSTILPSAVKTYTGHICQGICNARAFFKYVIVNMPRLYYLSSNKAERIEQEHTWSFGYSLPCVCVWGG